MEENNQIVEKITKIVNPFIEEMKLSLVDVEYVQDGGYWYVRIFIENLNGDLSIEDCSKLSSKIEDKVEELIDHKFFLEVSSPGLDRPLFTLAQYQRFIGQEIAVHLRIPMSDRRKWQGVLEKIEGDMLTLVVDGQPQIFVFGNIQKANVIPKF